MTFSTVCFLFVVWTVLQRAGYFTFYKLPEVLSKSTGSPVIDGVAGFICISFTLAWFGFGLYATYYLWAN